MALDQQFERDEKYQIVEKEKDFSKAALYQNFKAGDLLYGLEKTRPKYRSELKALPLQSNITIDQYNNLMLMDGRFLDLKKEDKDILNFQLASEYKAEFIQSHHFKKFQQKYPSTSTITSPPLDLYEDLFEGFKVEKCGSRSKSDLLILYSCRAAVESKLFPTIHFCLDDINIENVQQKIYTPETKGKSKVTKAIDYRFTTSELRFIYKNWGKLKDKVKFYKKGEIVGCPWEISPEEWKNNFLTTAQAKEKVASISNLPLKQSPNPIQKTIPLAGYSSFGSVSSPLHLIFPDYKPINSPLLRGITASGEEEKLEPPIRTEHSSKIFQFLGNNLTSPTKVFSNNNAPYFFNQPGKFTIIETNLKDNEAGIIKNDARKKNPLLKRGRGEQLCPDSKNEAQTKRPRH